MRCSIPIVALVLCACSSQGDKPTAEAEPATQAAASPEAAACNMVVAVTGMS